MRPLVLVLAALLLVPGTAAAAGAPPGWGGALEPGDRAQFEVQPAQRVGGTPPQVVTSPVRAGRYALALGLSGATTADDGICCGSRNELLPRVPALREGDDLWFGFSTRLGDGFPTSGGWQLITQFKQDGDGAPPLGLYVEEGSYKIEGGYGHPGGPRPFVQTIKPAVTGQWVDWLWHVRFSAVPGRGTVEVWADGEQLLAPYAPPGGTLYPGRGGRALGYVKTGPYRDPGITAPGVLYLDEWRIGRTSASVAVPISGSDAVTP